jgi:RHS repeat-associated protein
VGITRRRRRSNLSPFSVLFRLFALLMLGAFSANALAAATCTRDSNFPTLPETWQNCYASQASTLGVGGSIIDSCFVYSSWITPTLHTEDIVYYYYNGNGDGPYGYDFGGHCLGTAFSAKAAGCPNGGSCTGDPINAGTGNLYRKEEDYAGRWLRFARYYNSDTSVTADTIGNHWRHTYSRSVQYSSSSPTSATLLHEDGKAVSFTLSSGSWSSDADIHDTLAEQIDGSGNPTGWTHVRADTLDTEQYDANGHLTSIIDASGFQTNLTYSTSSTPTNIAPAPGYLITVTDPLGRGLQLTYGTVSGFASRSGFLKTMTDPNGNVYQYGYGGTNAAANLVSVTYPGTATARTFVYAESAHVANATAFPNALTGIVDENSARNATFDFDAIGNAIGTQHGAGADKFTLAYNSDGSADITDQQGGVSHHAFTIANSMALATTLSGPSIGFSNTAARTYDSYNNQLSTTDFDGRYTCYGYDAAHGLETSRIEGVTMGSCSGSPSGVRSIQTDWNTTLRTPTERRIYNASGTLETKTDWTYNTRGQVLAQCQVDPAVSGAMSYTCGSQTNAPTGVRQTTYTYCEQSGVTAGTCPVIGLVLTVDGPRTDVSDVTTYTYYQTPDLSGCATLGSACHSAGDLQKVTNALGQITTYVSYDKNGRVTRMQDTNGTYTDMTYHARGWLLTRTVRDNADGSASSNDAMTTFAYDNVGNVTKITQPDGVYLSYTYDAAHRLTDVTDNLSNTIHYTLDAAGNHTQEDTKDPSSTVKRTLSRQYDQLNRLLKTLNSSSVAVQTYQNPAEAPPTGITYTNGYDGNGNAVYSADANSIGTEQQYDPLNRLVKTLQDHAGTGTTKDTTTQYSYDARNNLRSVSDPESLITGYTYDGLNNLTALQSPDTGSSSYTYDAAGNGIAQTDALGVVTTYSYDSLNRLTSIAYPTTSLNVTYTYDQANSATGCASSYSVGRLTRMSDSSGTTVYCYDRRGNVTQKSQLVVGTGALVTNWALASNGGVASASSTDPSGNYPVATVNDGDRTGQTWGAGGGWQNSTPGVFHDYVQINFGTPQFIDAAIVYSLQDNYANGVDPSDTMTFSLYGITAFHVDVLSGGVWTTMATVTSNNLVKRKVNFPLTYASAIRVYIDAAADGQWSRLVEVDAGSDAHSLVTNSIYNNADRLNFLIYPSGDVIGYDRDAAGRTSDVTFMSGDPVPLVSGVSYSPFGPVNTITFANGRTLSKTYDKDYAISTIASSDPNGFALNATVDALGNLTGATASSNTRSYHYDPMYRLTQVQDGTGAQLEGYSYNGTGDRLSKTTGGTTQTYSYAAPLTSHQLQSVAGTARSYDANGNTTQIGNATFTYDNRNRLTAAGGASYFFNGRGERVIKRVGSNSTIFAYSQSGALLAEYASPFVCPNSNDLSNPDYYNCDPSFTGLSWPTEYLWMDGTLIGVVSNSNVYYVETDQLGTPRAVIQPGYPSNDPTYGDKVVWTWDYAGSAFGENAPNADPTNSGNPFTMNLRYPGQYHDTETGLHYNYLRDYDPASGRYVESDPIGLDGGLSTYGYVGGNPLGFRDIFGLCKVEARCNLLSVGPIFGKKMSHCYLVVTEPGGLQYYFRGGPSAKGGGLSAASSNSHYGIGAGGDAGYGNIITSSGNYVPGTIDWPTSRTPQTGSRTYIDNGKPCSGCMIRQLDRALHDIQSAGTPYNPLSTNSNSVAFQALQTIGVNPGVAPAPAPGWGIPLPGGGDNGGQCCDQ